MTLTNRLYFFKSSFWVVISFHIHCPNRYQLSSGQVLTSTLPASIATRYCCSCLSIQCILWFLFKICWKHLEPFWREANCFSLHKIRMNYRLTYLRIPFLKICLTWQISGRQDQTKSHNNFFFRTNYFHKRRAVRRRHYVPILGWTIRAQSRREQL